MKNFGTLLIALFIAGACSKMDSFEKNTQKLDKTTTKMSYTAEEIMLIANSIFPQIRSGDTIRVRNEEWDILTNPDKGLGEKFVASGIFFQALEYQFWTAKNSDNKDVLEYMFRDAADEFQGRMNDLYMKVNIKKMSPLNEGKKYNFDMAFYALAMTMDRRHHFQEEIQKRYPGLKFVTFMEIIETALVKEKENRELRNHENILLAGINKEIILELYKARVDIYAALALRDLVDQREMRLSHYSRAAIYMFTGGRFGSIEIPETYRDANASTKVNIIKYLTKAVEAKKFLTRIEVQHETEKKLKSALLAIELENDQNPGGDDKSKGQIEVLIKELL